MVKRLVMFLIFLVVLCSMLGCYREGAMVGFGSGLYYDGPYRNGPELFYYYDGGFYVYHGGDYRLHHYVPQDQRGYYEERYRKHHEQYHRDHPNSKNQHSGHPGYPPRSEAVRE